MFIENMWYTPQEIVELKYKNDIIYVNGISLSDTELLQEDILLKFYRYNPENGHPMFTIMKGGD